MHLSMHNASDLELDVLQQQKTRPFLSAKIKNLMLSWVMICINGLNVPKKHSPHHYTDIYQPGLLTQGMLGPWIHAGGAIFWPNHMYAAVEIEIHQT